MRRQPYYRSTTDRRPSPPRRPDAHGGGGVFFLLLLTFVTVLGATGYWRPWSGMLDEAPMATAEPFAPIDQQAPMLAGPSSSGPLASAVSIPPIAMALVAGTTNVTPTTVTPRAPGVARPAQPLVREPRMPTAPIPAVLRVPAGAGPFPAVIVLHGCSGPFTGMPDWAYRLNAWGYAALMPDSMTPRGVRNVCDPADQQSVTAWDRMGDIGAAAAWLRSRHDIDPDRIAVLGVSHGGGTAALATLSPYAGIRLRAAVDYYGPCIEPRLHGSLPLMVLAGEKDDWGDPAAKCAAFGKQVQASEPFELHTYPGVYHGFDAGPAAQSTYFGHIVQRNQAAAEDSFVRVHGFLDRWVMPLGVRP